VEVDGLMLSKKEFREKLAVDLLGDEVVSVDPADTPEAAVNAGLRDGWLCRWPDCDGREFACGTKYGCSMAKEEIQHG
jgi:hypothetical protein